MTGTVEAPAGAETYCADLSLTDDEPMIATAANIHTWFLLEYSGTWQAMATTDNDLPAPIQAWLKDQLAQVNQSRLQFIRQTHQTKARGLAFFVVQTRETSPILHEFRLEDYQDLLRLDMPALLTEAAAYAGHLRTESLYLVCTNGRRDRCCARLGVSLYQALVGQVGSAAWQTTHFGGHRFAPNLVTFPDGVFYGRLTPADLEPFLAARAEGQLFWSHLRGRCCYDKVVQAADHFLRQETGVLDQASYRLVDFHPLEGDTQWMVRFSQPAARQIHQLILNREMVSGERLVSCSPPKTEAVTHFQLVAYEHLVA